MNGAKHLGALAFSLVLMGALAGCAVYRKCGFEGCPGDAQITAAVRAMLQQYPALGPPNLLWVQTLNQVVYLTGQVNTELERQIAESAARAAPGAARVVNTIAVSNVR